MKHLALCILIGFALYLMEFRGWGPHTFLLPAFILLV